MGDIRRVPQSVSGVPDGVEFETSGVLTDFLRRKMKQRKLSCSLKASWATDVCSISFADGNRRKMISVRLDDLCALLSEAADARIELDKAALDKTGQQESSDDNQ